MCFFTSDYSTIKEKSIYGRYITYDHISSLLKKLDARFRVAEIGKSVKGVAIDCIDFGSGPTKILMWSQMHGNESTTTKAVFDVLNFIKSENSAAQEILKNCTIRIIPMLNPDGAAAYTRVNANGIDLNRDAQDLSQPESSILRNTYTDFQPNFCFNLHDQRTMYNVGESDKSATVSFLAPAFNQERDISSSRLKAMLLINKMNKVLQELIPGQVGRYDDAFNANCVGDTFQLLETPTVLFEAGHFPDDYERERTREFICIALLEGIAAAMQIGHTPKLSESHYYEIPENGKRFYDILIKNPIYFDMAYDKGVVLGIRYEENLIEDKIQFEGKLEALFGEGHFLGHHIYDCSIEDELQILKKQSFFSKLLS